MAWSNRRIALTAAAGVVGLAAIIVGLVVNRWYLGFVIGLAILVLGGVIAFQRDTEGTIEGGHGESHLRVSDKGVGIMFLGAAVMALSLWQAGNTTGVATATASAKIPPAPTVAPESPLPSTVTVTVGPTVTVDRTLTVSPTGGSTGTATSSPATTAPPVAGPWFGNSSTIKLIVERCSVSRSSGILSCYVRLENNSDEAVFVRKSGFIAVDEREQSYELDTKARSQLQWDAEDGYYPTYTFAPNTTRAGAVVLAEKLPASAKVLKLRFEYGRDGSSLTPVYDVVSADVELDGIPLAK